LKKAFVWRRTSNLRGSDVKKKGTGSGGCGTKEHDQQKHGLRGQLERGKPKVDPRAVGPSRTSAGAKRTPGEGDKRKGDLGRAD